MPASAGKTVLVVEDNAITRDGLAMILGRAGYPVLTASNGQEALDLLASGTAPDLILLGMLMPVLDGWHFLGRLKAQGVTVPLVVTTGTIRTREWAAANGCAGFLRKPIEEDALLAEVRRGRPNPLSRVSRPRLPPPGGSPRTVRATPSARRGRPA
jgi:CheY-like chemotaxis protein